MTYPLDSHAPCSPPILTGGGHRPPAGQPARPEADDALVHFAGLILGFLAALLLATAAAVVGLAAYGLITWRRTRWWPPVLLGGVLGLVAVAAFGGPGPALHYHLLAARELTSSHSGGLAELVLRRWPAWTGAQLPLSIPIGLITAGLARHRVTHLPAHELSPGAQTRRTAEHQAQLRKARRRAGVAPLKVNGAPVLGAWVAGDLTAWKAGEWCTLPDGTLGLGTVVLGLPGAGKTETLLRLAELGLASGYDVHVIDAKGDPATQARFAALAKRYGQEAKLFPEAAYDGWRGDPTALRNRLGRVVDYTEPYYQDGARVLLDAATRQKPEGLDALLAGIADSDTDVDNQVRKGTLSRYRSFSSAAGDHLSGDWAFEDTHASYLLLDGVALGDDTPRLARYLLEDFQHYAAARKAPGQKALLVVDEFSALRVSNAAALLERLRSFGCGVIIAAQSIEGLHDEPNERARLLGAATTVIAHRLADPELVAARAGTTKRAERSHQLDQLGATGMGSLRIQETYRIDPNDLRNLPPGVAWITTAGRAAKVAVTRGGQDRSAFPRNNRPQAEAGETPGLDRRSRRLTAGSPDAMAAYLTPDRPDEVCFFEAQLPSACESGGCDDVEGTEPEGAALTSTPEVDEQDRMLQQSLDDLLRPDTEGETPTETAAVPSAASPAKPNSPYAWGIEPCSEE